ncbi:phosphonoacetaldehyde hydrolase-like [Elysia marginata]|uniref:Phosphonoacetaldehyde hydrolase-like n=1 Tax=Elysia marginata TaxID=1093978 RepID=A0AAV4J4S6_9GAST|nr:phosphonoacetaldehyde hydrolase-like [Elysia marginata]
MLRAPFRYARSYVGPVKACILDWSGTTVDKYVLAPAVVFVEVFNKYKVPISMAESRQPMGLRKDLHIKAITEMPSVRQRWKEVHGKYPDQSDVDAMFKDFVPMQMAVLGKFVPDVNVTGDEVVNGVRPKPFMLYKNLDLLDIPNLHSVVKVDDTLAGVGEALSAGCWGVGVARYSNYMDVDSLEAESELEGEELKRRLDNSRSLLVQSGAHYVIDSIVELPDVVADINERLSRGERP